MRLFAMYLLAALAVSSVSAASYQKTDHTIVDSGTALNGNAHKVSWKQSEPRRAPDRPNPTVQSTQLPFKMTVHQVSLYLTATTLLKHDIISMDTK
jgi:hypothetical protein